MILEIQHTFYHKYYICKTKHYGNGRTTSVNVKKLISPLGDITVHNSGIPSILCCHDDCKSDKQGAAFSELETK